MRQTSESHQWVKQLSCAKSIKWRLYKWIKPRRPTCEEWSIETKGPASGIIINLFVAFWRIWRMIPFKVVPMIILQHIAFSKKTSSPVAKKSDIERTHHKRVQILRMILDICLIAVLISNVASENNVHIDFVIYLLISMSNGHCPCSMCHPLIYITPIRQ